MSVYVYFYRTFEKKFLVKQHLQSEKHIKLKGSTNVSQSQSFVAKSLTSPHVEFAKDLCSAFVCADIPLFKIRNQKLVQFFEKWCSQKVPSETSLRTNYVKQLYSNTVEKIQLLLKDHFIWIAIDETTDSAGRYVANVVVGILHENVDVAKQRFLLNVAVLEVANHTTVARLFDESVRLLGEGFNRDSILLFLSDAAPYMVKAARAIQIFYPKITHVTCIIHGLHRTCEFIRGQFQEVDQLISNVKKIFLKAPQRVAKFKIMHPGLPLPPQPIITRWGTWLDAVCYYSKYFEKIVEIVQALDEEETTSIKISKKILQASTIKRDLIYIASNYGFLSSSIAKLETSNISLLDQLEVLSSAQQAVEAVQGEIGEYVKQKLNAVVQKNTSIPLFKTIAEYFRGSSTNTCDPKYTISEICSFKFAPLSSVDVERTFSMYKSVFRPNRQSFLFENLSQIFVIYCNNSIN